MARATHAAAACERLLGLLCCCSWVAYAVRVPQEQLWLGTRVVLTLGLPMFCAAVVGLWHQRRSGAGVSWCGQGAVELYRLM